MDNHQLTQEQEQDRLASKKEVVNHIGLQYIMEDLQPEIDGLYDQLDNLSKGRTMEEYVMEHCELNGMIHAYKRIFDIFASIKKS